MNKKILIGVGVIIIIAAGWTLNQKGEEVYDYGPSLTNDFEVSATGGGKFNIGEEVKIGFVMKYVGKSEKKGLKNSTFSTQEATVFISNTGVLAPSGKKEIPVREIAQLEEALTYELKGYACVKEGFASILFNPILFTYDIDGEQQKRDGRSDGAFREEVYVSIECVAEVEMFELTPVNPVIPAGTSPLGELERLRKADELPSVR